MRRGAAVIVAILAQGELLASWQKCLALCVLRMRTCPVLLLQALRVFKQYFVCFLNLTPPCSALCASTLGGWSRPNRRWRAG